MKLKLKLKYSHKCFLSVGLASTSLCFASGSLIAKDFILGGQDVGAKDPIQNSTVGIYEPSASGHGGSLCTGSIIGKGIALTAAHCVQPGGPKPVLVFARDLHAPDASVRQAQAIAVNPNWQTRAGRGMDQGDIALVKFPGALPPGYHKVSMVRADSQIVPGEAAVLAGYGISNAQTKTGAGRLRKTEVRILKSRPGKSEMILDQTHGHGACHGDSGGPAFIRQKGKMVLAGVTNRGYPNRAPDDCAHKVVYTKVPAYRSWIQKSEKKLASVHAPTDTVFKQRFTKRLLAKRSSKRRVNKQNVHVAT